MYNWDLEELKRRKDELVKIRKSKRKTLSEIKLLKLDCSLMTYDYLLDAFKEEEPFSEIILESDKTFVSTRFKNIYSSINPRIIEATINSFDIFENSGIDICFDSTSREKLENQTVIEMTKEIFSSFNDQKISQIVNEILDPNNHLLHITKGKETSIYETDYSGFSCRDYYNNIGYAIIYSNEKIRDLYTLVHELFHLIINNNKTPNSYFEDNFYVSEVEGSFADLLVTDYLINKGILIDEARNVELINYSNSRYFIRNLHLAHNFHNYFDKDNFDVKRINQVLETKNLSYSIDREDMLNVVNSFTRDLNYGFSFLVALDLFYKYKNGYNGIINDMRDISNGKNIFIFLERYGVNFFNDGYKNLDSYQKSLIKQKR